MSHHLSPRIRFALAAAAGTALALAPASAAFAHIDPDPPAIEAGAEATVSFTVEHGCEGSPTTKVEIQLPDGATGIAGVDGGGFTSSVDGQVVTFEGGPLDADAPQGFEVTFTAPGEPGEVPVKIIQTCEEGAIDWIEVAADGEEEPEHPAPVLTLTEGAPTGEEGTDHHAEEGAGDEGDHHAEEGAGDEGDHHAEEGAGDEGDHHAEEGAEPAAAADEGEGDGGSSTPWIVGGVALLVVGGGAFAAMRGRGGAGPDGAGGDAAPGA